MRWIFRSAPEADVERLAHQAGITPVLARILVARGISDAQQVDPFLSPSLSALHSPYLMSGMRIAVERISAAIERRERLLIHGDYDVDGTIAIVVLKTAIEICGGQADFYVPHRIRDGYGLKEDGIERAAAAGARLIISVDTGIRSFDAACAARRLGIDLIVTDHHLPEADGVPDALAVLNPNQPGCAYPCKALCGAGVAFKLAQALLEKNNRGELLPSFLKVVAIATIADAVSLTGENRILASLGLDGLRHPVNKGLKALFEVAALDNSRRLVASDIAFRLAPRLNAAGRMDVAAEVVELFQSPHLDHARAIAARLNQLNLDRQQQEQTIISVIDRRFADDPSLRDSFCLVLDGEGWHRGVIGIAATRVVERWNRPALVISTDGPEAYGSGRSIPRFPLLEALESCRHLFTRFGGHAHAVGFALPSERVPELRKALDLYARERLTSADFEPVLRVDAEICLSAINPDFYRTLLKLEPFGMGNPEPVFIARNTRLLSAPRLLKEKHVKLRIGPGAESGPSFFAVGWRMATRTQPANFSAGDCVDIAFKLDHNSHPDFGGLELRLEDLTVPQSEPSIAANA